MAKKSTIVTPPGTAQYPYLCEPDTRWDEDGHYKVNLILAATAAEPIITHAQKLIDVFYKEKLAELKKGDGKAKAKAKTLAVKEPFEVHYDSEGDETSDVVLKFKTKAKIKDKKTGQLKDKKVPLYDGKKQPIKHSLNVGPGSLLRVNATPSVWYMGKDNCVGCTFYLNAAQILELVEYGGSADAMGFDDDGEFEVDDSTQVDSEDIKRGREKPGDDDDVDF